VSKKSDFERSDELLEEVGHLPEPTDLPDDEELAELFAVEDGYCEECGAELDAGGNCLDCDYWELQADTGDEDWPSRESLEDEDYDA